MSAEITLTSRGRRISDAMSGMAISRDHHVYESFTQDELEAMFARFKQFDISDSGYISAEDLKNIFNALEIEVGEHGAENIIEEVALLTDHENDGKLSFRDYVALTSYELAKKAVCDAAEADEERRLSQRLEDDEGENSDGVAHEASETGQEAAADTVGELEAAKTEAAAEAPRGRRRGSSFAVLETIAVSRIARFEQLVAVVTKPEPSVSQRKFADKLSKFKKIETGEAAPPTLNHESMHVQTLKAKMSAFEDAAKRQDPIAFKTSWKNVKPGSWRQKKSIAGGVAPKKSLADLP